MFTGLLRRATATAVNPIHTSIRTATKKSGGTVVNTADSAGRRLGVKRLGDEEVKANHILVRQRGFRWHPGLNVYHGKDHTLHAKVDGYVKFFNIQIPGKTRSKFRTYVNVLPERHGREEELVDFAAAVVKRYRDALQYRKSQKDFMKKMRRVHGPNVRLTDFVRDRDQVQYINKRFI